MKRFFKSSSLLIIILFFSLTSIAYASLTFSNTGIVGDASFTTLTIPGITGSGCLTISSSGVVSSTGSSCGSSGVGSTDIKTINSISLTGTGDVPIGTLIGFTPEDSANKSTSVTTDGSSDTKYPSVKAVKDYADSLITGLLNYRGAYDASSNAWPTTGGSGTGGAVMKGDTYVISVAGTLGGSAIQIGDSIIANTDNPGQTASNWNTLNTNITYVPEDSANKVTSISGSSTNVQYPSAKLLYDQLALKQNTLDATNLKTINDSSLLGSGNLTIGGSPSPSADIPAFVICNAVGCGDTQTVNNWFVSSPTGITFDECGADIAVAPTAHSVSVDIQTSGGVSIFTSPIVLPTSSTATVFNSIFAHATANKGDQFKAVITQGDTNGAGQFVYIKCRTHNN